MDKLNATGELRAQRAWALRLRGCVLLPLAVYLFLACGTDPSGSEAQRSITVFCGSASKPAMEEIAGLFEKEKNIRVNMTFGGSGTLLSQIELSKKGEIYLPGSPDYIIIGNRKKLLVENSDKIVAYLVPAIITPAGNPKGIGSLADLAKPGIKVGIGNPRTVCLGLYGIELLKANHLLGGVMKNVVTHGASCSKTANLAAMNKVDAVLGWKVFQSWNSDRLSYVPIDPDQIPRISYIPISIPIYTKDASLSKAFIDFTLSPKGRRIYRKFGYLTDLEDAKKFAPDATVGGEYKLPDEYYELVGEAPKDR